MPDPNELRSLKAELEAHKKKLDEIQQRYGTPDAAVEPETAREHAHSMREVVVATTKTVQTLIELLGQAGL